MSELVLSQPVGSSRDRSLTKGEVRRQTADEAFRQARSMFAIAGVEVGHRKLSRLVRAFLASQETAKDFGTWVIEYADPTGDTAVWHLLQTACPGCGRQGRRRCSCGGGR